MATQIAPQPHVSGNIKIRYLWKGSSRQRRRLICKSGLDDQLFGGANESSRVEPTLFRTLGSLSHRRVWPWPGPLQKPAQRRAKPKHVAA